MSAIGTSPIPWSFTARERRRKRRAAALLTRAGDNQALGGAWFYVSTVDDVRGDWLLLLGGVAYKVTAHTPAR